MVFCNVKDCSFKLHNNCHNPYFSRWFSAIEEVEVEDISTFSHNPYFSRWFSAMSSSDFKLKSDKCHNPYFSRWFSAIEDKIIKTYNLLSHNPYFSRWFSAILLAAAGWRRKKFVTILILVDGFLQCFKTIN